MNSFDKIVGEPLKIPHVVDTDYLGGFKLRLLFDDGKQGVFDFAELFGKPAFAGLKDRYQFIQYGLEYGTIVWANGMDISPEFLHNSI